ncbi:MAG: Hpt domain-containing protein [Pirellulaceae bacterium]
MLDNMDRFRETFFEEAAEHLANMESALLELEHSSGDQELLNNIFRCAHSIKGASGTFGLDEIARFTHSLENLLDRMRAGTLESSPERLDLLLRSSDILRGLLASARSGSPSPPGVEHVLAELNGILGHEAKPVPTRTETAYSQMPATPQEYRVIFVPDRDLLRQGMDPLLLLRDVSQAGEILDIVADLSRLPPLSELDPESCYLGWSVRLMSAQSPEQIAEVFMFVQDNCRVAVEVLTDATPAAGDCPPPPPTSDFTVAESPAVSLRVPLAKADDLIEVAMALIHAQAFLMQAASDFALRR